MRDYLQLTLRTLFRLKPSFNYKMSNLSHISIADCRRHTFGIAWVLLLTVGFVSGADLFSANTIFLQLTACLTNCALKMDC